MTTARLKVQRCLTHVRQFCSTRVSTRIDANVDARVVARVDVHVSMAVQGRSKMVSPAYTPVYVHAVTMLPQAATKVRATALLPRCLAVRLIDAVADGAAWTWE